MFQITDRKKNICSCLYLLFSCVMKSYHTSGTTYSQYLSKFKQHIIYTIICDNIKYTTIQNIYYDILQLKYRILLEDNNNICIS